MAYNAATLELDESALTGESLPVTKSADPVARAPASAQYNHYSLLRTIEDIFTLLHLGDAAMPQARSFGPDVFG